MTLDCSITEMIKSDFNLLWNCKQSGDTLEISTPYLMPNSTLLSIFLTKREGRYIVCDGGSLIELLNEHCELPPADMNDELSDIAERFRMKEGAMDGETLYFKECTDPKIISALVFEVANFALSAASSLVFASAGSLPDPQKARFQTKADSFIREIKPKNLSFLNSREIEQVPGVQFSAVLVDSKKIWILSYVTGSSATYFRRSISDTVMNFEHAWKSSLKRAISRTIPVIDTEARGFKRDKHKWQLDRLQKESHDSTVYWSNRQELHHMLSTSNGINLGDLTGR